MSLAETIARMLEPLPLPQRLKVLKEAEKLAVGEKASIIRKVTRRGRSLAVSIPSSLEGRYTLQIDRSSKSLIYVHDPAGEIHAKKFASRGSVMLPVPKGAWEEIGRPEYVLVEVLEDKIILTAL